MQLNINGTLYEHTLVLYELSHETAASKSIIAAIVGVAPHSVRYQRLCAFIDYVEQVRSTVSDKMIQHQLEQIQLNLGDPVCWYWYNDEPQQSGVENVAGEIESTSGVGSQASTVGTLVVEEMKLKLYSPKDLVDIQSHGMSDGPEKMLGEMLSNVRQNLELLIAQVPRYQNDELQNDQKEDTEAKAILPPRDDGRKSMNVAAVTYANGESFPTASANTNAPGSMKDVFQAQQRLRIIVDTTAQRHAEMKILDGFYTQKALAQLRYIGISKACCLACAAVLVIAQRNNVPVRFKGTHGKTFGPGWFPPNYLLKEPANLAAFLGPQAWGQYQNLKYSAQQVFILRLASSLKQ